MSSADINNLLYVTKEYENKVRSKVTELKSDETVSDLTSSINQQLDDIIEEINNNLDSIDEKVGLASQLVANTHNHIEGYTINNLLELPEQGELSHFALRGEILDDFNHNNYDFRPVFNGVRLNKLHPTSPNGLKFSTDMRFDSNKYLKIVDYDLLFTEYSGEQRESLIQHDFVKIRFFIIRTTGDNITVKYIVKSSNTMEKTVYEGIPDILGGKVNVYTNYDARIKFEFKVQNGRLYSVMKYSNRLDKNYDTGTTVDTKYYTRDVEVEKMFSDNSSMFTDLTQDLSLQGKSVDGPNDPKRNITYKTIKPVLLDNSDEREIRVQITCIDRSLVSEDPDAFTYDYSEDNASTLLNTNDYTSSTRVYVSMLNKSLKDYYGFEKAFTEIGDDYNLKFKKAPIYALPPGEYTNDDVITFATEALNRHNVSLNQMIKIDGGTGASTDINKHALENYNFGNLYRSPSDMLIPMNWEVPQNVTKHDSSFMNYNCSILSGSNESGVFIQYPNRIHKNTYVPSYTIGFDKDEDDILIPPSMDLIFAKHGTETAIVNTKKYTIKVLNDGVTFVKPTSNAAAYISTNCVNANLLWSKSNGIYTVLRFSNGSSYRFNHKDFETYFTRIDNINYLFIPATCILDNIFDNTVSGVGDLRNVVYDEDNLGSAYYMFSTNIIYYNYKNDTYNRLISTGVWHFDTIVRLTVNEKTNYYVYCNTETTNGNKSIFKCVGSELTKVFTSLHYIEQIEIIDDVFFFVPRTSNGQNISLMKGIITEGSELGSITEEFLMRDTTKPGSVASATINVKTFLVTDNVALVIDINETIYKYEKSTGKFELVRYQAPVQKFFKHGDKIYGYTEDYKMDDGIKRYVLAEYKYRSDDFLEIPTDIDRTFYQSSAPVTSCGIKNVTLTYKYPILNIVSPLTRKNEWFILLSRNNSEKNTYPLNTNTWKYTNPNIDNIAYPMFVTKLPNGGYVKYGVGIRSNNKYFIGFEYIKRSITQQTGKQTHQMNIPIQLFILQEFDKTDLGALDILAQMFNEASLSGNDSISKRSKFVYGYMSDTWVLMTYPKKDGTNYRLGTDFFKMVDDDLVYNDSNNDHLDLWIMDDGSKFYERPNNVTSITNQNGSKSLSISRRLYYADPDTGINVSLDNPIILNEVYGYFTKVFETQGRRFYTDGKTIWEIDNNLQVTERKTGLDIIDIEPFMDKIYMVDKYRNVIQTNALFEEMTTVLTLENDKYQGFTKRFNKSTNQNEMFLFCNSDTVLGYMVTGGGIQPITTTDSFVAQRGLNQQQIFVEDNDIYIVYGSDIVNPRSTEFITRIKSQITTDGVGNSDPQIFDNSALIKIGPNIGKLEIIKNIIPAVGIYEIGAVPNGTKANLSIYENGVKKYLTSIGLKEQDSRKVYVGNTHSITKLSNNAIFNNPTDFCYDYEYHPYLGEHNINRTEHDMSFIRLENQYFLPKVIKGDVLFSDAPMKNDLLLPEYDYKYQYDPILYLGESVDTVVDGGVGKSSMNNLIFTQIREFKNFVVGVNSNNSRSQKHMIYGYYSKNITDSFRRINTIDSVTLTEAELNAIYGTTFYPMVDSDDTFCLQHLTTNTKAISAYISKLDDNILGISSHVTNPINLTDSNLIVGTKPSAATDFEFINYYTGSDSISLPVGNRYFQDTIKYNIPGYDSTYWRIYNGPHVYKNIVNYRTSGPKQVFEKTYSGVKINTIEPADPIYTWDEFELFVPNYKTNSVEKRRILTDSEGRMYDITNYVSLTEITSNSQLSSYRIANDPNCTDSSILASVTATNSRASIIQDPVAFYQLYRSQGDGDYSYNETPTQIMTPYFKPMNISFYIDTNGVLRITNSTERINEIRTKFVAEIKKLGVPDAIANSIHNYRLTDIFLNTDPTNNSFGHIRIVDNIGEYDTFVDYWNANAFVLLYNRPSDTINVNGATNVSNLGNLNSPSLHVFEITRNNMSSTLSGNTIKAYKYIHTIEDKEVVFTSEVVSDKTKHMNVNRLSNVGVSKLGDNVYIINAFGDTYINGVFKFDDYVLKDVQSGSFLLENELVKYDNIVDTWNAVFKYTIEYEGEEYTYGPFHIPKANFQASKMAEVMFDDISYRGYKTNKNLTSTIVESASNETSDSMRPNNLLHAGTRYYKTKTGSNLNDPKEIINKSLKFGTRKSGKVRQTLFNGTSLANYDKKLIHKIPAKFTKPFKIIAFEIQFINS